MSRSPWAWPLEQSEPSPHAHAREADLCGLDRVLERIGSRTALASALGISIQAVSQWKRIPHLRVLDIERITGISRHELRPDIYPLSVDVEARQ